MLGGFLATVDDQAENDFLAQSLASVGGPYIGLSDEAVEGTFVWDSGDPSAFRNFAAGEPNNDGDEDYVVMVNDGTWFDIPDLDRPAIVEIAAPHLPTPSATHGGHDYVLIAAPDLRAARRAARAFGGYLASVNDMAENDFLVQTFLTRFAVAPFIGLSDEVSEGTFVWESDEPVTYTNFASGEPSGDPGENYVHMRVDGTWNDVPADGSSFAIVEIPSVRPTDVGITHVIGGDSCDDPSLPASVTLVLTNFGQPLPAGTSIAIEYAVNGGVPVSDTVTLASVLPTAAGLPVPLTLSPNPGVADIVARSLAAGDDNPSNDAVRTVTNTSPFRVTPDESYFEDFERGEGRWTTTGGSWELGTPMTPTLTAFSGVNAWVTDLDGNYPSGSSESVVSPCFDFSALSFDPMLRFRISYVTESSYDGCLVALDLDDGLGFRQLGSRLDRGWYDGTLVGGGPDVFTGYSGGYRGVGHVLQGAAGRTNVRIRIFFRSDASFQSEGVAFDDVEIKAPVCNGTRSLANDDIDQTLVLGASLVRPDRAVVMPSTTVTLHTTSPDGTLIGQPLLIIGDLRATGSPLATPFPGICVDPMSAFLMAGGQPQFPLILPAGGHALAFSYPGGLAGASLVCQAIVTAPSPLTDNGIFASTDPKELTLQ